MKRIVLAFSLLTSIPVIAQEAQSQKWEYAMYYEVFVPKVGANFRWVQPGVDKQAPTSGQLAQALGCPVSTDPVLRAEILNCVGKQGWELVAVNTVSLTGSSTPIEFYFKRPVK